MGLLREAGDGLSDALASVPDEPTTLFFLGHLAHYEHQHAAAVDYFRRGLAIEPTHYSLNLFHPLVWLYQDELGRAEEAIATAQHYAPDDTMVASIESLLWAKRGERTKAEEAIARALDAENSRVHSHHIGHNAAATFALLGRPQDAIAQVRNAAGAGLPNYALFKSDPHLRSLREEPEFMALLTELERDTQTFQEEFGRG